MSELKLARKLHKTRYCNENFLNRLFLTEESHEGVRFLKKNLEHPLLTSSKCPCDPILVHNHALLRKHKKVMMGKCIFEI